MEGRKLGKIPGKTARDGVQDSRENRDGVQDPGENHRDGMQDSREKGQGMSAGSWGKSLGTGPGME